MVEDTSSRLSDNDSDDSLDIEGLDQMNFDDPEGYEDIVSDQDLIDEYQLEIPRLQSGHECLVVIDNVPQVNKDRLEKLKKVITKNVSIHGEITNIYFPMGEDGQTKGFIFIEYATPEMTRKALEAENNRKLDKSHIFKTYTFDDFVLYSQISDEWETPVAEPYEDPGDLRSWLLNPNCEDEFAITKETKNLATTDINMGALNNTNLFSREGWTNSYVRWSPQGTYFLAFHEKGIALWGGGDFNRLSRLSHPHVDLVDFSPCERYLVTLSVQMCKDINSGQDAIIIWDLRTATIKRTFNANPEMNVWPVFKWSHDGTYFARLNKDSLSVYQTSDFSLLDLKSIKIKLIKDFSWSPTDNLISYWVEEESNGAARISLIEIPSRKLKAMKNLFKVRDCKMHWQRNGDYLCVKVDRYGKLTKDSNSTKYTGMSYVFNVFRIRDKEIPIDDIIIKETIMAFAWEPVGSKFGYIHGDNQRVSVSFCDVKGGKIECVKTFDKLRPSNSLYWSPSGQFCVIAGLRQLHGTLDFIDTHDMTMMNSTEHFNATDLEWDPTGRYITTAINSYLTRSDNGYWIWSFQGKLLRKETVELQRQFVWRPRPKCLLTAEMLRDLKRNMKQYNQTFALDDKMKEKKATKEQIDKRRDLMLRFTEWREDLQNIYESEAEERFNLRAGKDVDDVEMLEEHVQFLINTEEFVV